MIQPPAAEGQSPADTLYPELKRNEERFRSVFAQCSDVVYRSIDIDGKGRALLVYIEGLADNEGLEKQVISPLQRERALTVSDKVDVRTFEDCLAHVLDGRPILLRDGQTAGLALGLTKWEKRGIEEPSAESSVRGPREGFTETLRVNTSQIRRIVKSPKLKIEEMKIGRYTQTKIAVAYLEGLADRTLIDEIKARLGRIRIDGILESGYIEELIEDTPYSPFPQLLSTERPDVVCGNLLEGRAAILVDGTPFALVAPITFFSLLQSPEDYYQRYIISTVIRWLRYSYLLFSLLLPSLYVAVLTFHQEMVPGSLLLSMASSREEVPFPALVEALLMEITFEALREAGVRLPKQVGSAISIVGALVIGQAAVQAGIVSAPMVIIVALTGISSFMTPRYIAGISIRMLRFPMIFLAGSLGLLGIMMGIILLVLHLCSLRSFGVPYLSTLQTPNFGEFKDVFYRAPWWSMKRRPRLTGSYDEYRETSGLKPGPEHGGESG